MKEGKALIRYLNCYAYYTVDECGNMWYSASDIATGLGYSENIVRKVCNLIIDIPIKWKKKVYVVGTDRNGNKVHRTKYYLSEEGVTMFMMESRKKRALLFQTNLAKIAPRFIDTWAKEVKELEYE